MKKTNKHTNNEKPMNSLQGAEFHHPKIKFGQSFFLRFVPVFPETHPASSPKRLSSPGLLHTQPFANTHLLPMILSRQLEQFKLSMHRLFRHEKTMFKENKHYKASFRIN